MNYWLGVAKRAGVEAATDVRLGKVTFAATVISQAVLALVLFTLLGLTPASLPTRMATAVLPLLVFPVFFLVRLITVPAALDAERSDKIGELERAVEDQYWTSIGGDKARNHAQLYQLRELYKLDHDNLPPELMSGLAWPPVEWLNEKLARQGAMWRVDRIDAEKVFTKSVEG